MTRGVCGAPLIFAMLALGCQGSDIAIFTASAGGSGGSTDDQGTAGTVGSSAGGLGGSAVSSGASGAASGDMGGLDAGSSGTACAATSDCPGPGWVCTKADCSATVGVCVPVPLFCPPDASPVCGCDDHVTYWNDCVRQQAGECASSSGECGGGARACNVSTDCPFGASCSHLLPPSTSCNQPGPGNCWVTPSDGCPSGIGSASGDPRHWMPCGGIAQGGGPPPCISTCQAIQAGHPYQPVPPGVQCF